MRRVAVLAAITAAACSAGDNAVDPGDLALRDLLGISPEIASGWSSAQRASARLVLIAGLSTDDEPVRAALDPVGPAGIDLDGRLASLLAAADARRGGDGADPLGVVRVAIDTRDAAIAPRLAPTTVAALDAQTIAGASRSAATTAIATSAHDTAITSRPGPTATVAAAAHSGLAPPRADPTTAAAGSPHSREPTELWLAPRWDGAGGGAHLAGRGIDVLSALADDADHPGGPLVVVPSPRLAVIAAYLAPSGDGGEARLAVNPVLLAALEPRPEELAVAAALERAAPTEPPEARSSGGPGARPPLADTTAIASTGGNPYSFYGSVGECAFAQRTRCEACLAGSTCSAITDASSGNDECTALAASSGRGYFLLCINLSLAITSVERCTGDAAASCARDPDAAGSLTTLEGNAGFLEDPTCAGALDACLAKIYGAPDDPFPGIDGGSPPPAPPRSTNVSCGDACSNNNSNCTASPTCDCTGPSCNNSLSCDSACSSSNDQSGCNGNCNACTSSGGGGGTGGGGCGGGSSSSSDGCGSSSGSGGSCGSSSGSGGSCGSCGSGNGGSCSSSSGSGGSCGSCGSGSGGSCGSSSGGSSCSGGGGSSKCSVATVDPGPGAGVAMSLIWGLMPVPVAAFTRRRAARRRGARERERGTGNDASDLSSGPTAGAASEDAP